MDNFMEEWVDKKIESSKEDGLQEKISNEIGETLDSEDEIEQIIKNIDDEKLRFNLRYCLQKKDNPLSPEKCLEEISIYLNEVKSRMEDEAFNNLFHRLVNSKTNILPSTILQEFQIRDEILRESNPEIKKLMEISLDKTFPSRILRDRNAYEELAKVTNPDEKEIILRYLKDGFSANGTKDEHSYYTIIKNHNYKCEDLKDFVLSLINEEGEDPSNILFVFELFMDRNECGDETKEFIRSYLNSSW